ncbi:MAG: thioredoxin domain-containing protein [Anaerolineae bacterium]|nr:thioredoxin domain-containing protein [Anaerolineae bacterium]
MNPLWAFAFGAVLGALITALVVVATRPQQASLTPDEIRQAAREGAAQALQSMPTAMPAAPAETQPAPTPTPELKVSVRAPNAQGDPNAPVLIVEYSDFECTYCRRFYAETFPKIIQDYVKTGKVRITYKHFPVLAESSGFKAEAAECAADQGKFWEFHNLLFSGRIPAGNRETVQPLLVEAARELGMNVEAFTACLNDGRTRIRVGEDFQEAQSFDVRGTPSFWINGQLLVGAQPYIAFQSAIERALADANRAR